MTWFFDVISLFEWIDAVLNNRKLSYSKLISLEKCNNDLLQEADAGLYP